MVRTESIPNRKTIPLRLLPVVILLSVGCHQFDHRCSWLKPYPEIPPRHETEMAMLNAGYCETQWIPLDPNCGPIGYIEHFSDRENIPSPVIDNVAAPQADVQTAEAEGSSGSIAPIIHTRPVILDADADVTREDQVEVEHAVVRERTTPDLQDYLRP